MPPCAHTSPLTGTRLPERSSHHARLHRHNAPNLGTAVRSTSPFLRRIVLCVGLTALNIFVVAKFAEVLYQATLRHPFEQVGVTLLFAALVSSLARTWFLALSSGAR